jgi:hypothetical protein
MKAAMNTNRKNQYLYCAKRLFAQSLWLLAMLMFAGLTSIRAQQTTGSIVGTVKDQTGAVINTATVKATNLDTGFSRLAQTNGYGEYRIDYLPVGRYTVGVAAASFKHFVQENIDLNVDQTLTLEVILSIGAQSETVTITAAPPLVNTSTAELGATIEGAEIVGLPLVNRNAYSELSLTPGVMANSYSAASNPSGTPNFVVGIPSADVQINGSIDGGNPEVAFYLDGGNNQTGMRNYGNQLPNPDALQEFRVETSNFAAQYGHFSSAVITAITKSGTNSFHGALFEFNRNTDFNAWQWNPGTSPKVPYHRNNFGGNIGGPIKRDKSFFFFSYGGLRQVVGQSLTGAIVPTAAERLGDFTGDTFKVLAPGTLTQVAGTNSSPNCAIATPNCIPTALLDKAVSNMNNTTNTLGLFVPLPNGVTHPATGGASYTGVFTGPTVENEYLAKYDEALRDKDHLAVTYFYIKSTQGAYGGGNIPYMVTNSITGQTNANISDVHTFSPSTANQAWLTFTRAAGGRVNTPTTNLGQFGSDFTIQGPSGPPDLSISGDFTAGGGLAGPVTVSDWYQIRDMVTMTKGKHTLNYGGEFALDKTMFLGNLDNYGILNFSASTSTPATPGGETSTGNAMSDYVTGQLSSMEQDTPYHTLMSAWHTAVYLQDNYRITPRLTANLGLRWDIDTAPVESSNLASAFVPGQQSTINPTAPTGQLFPGDKGIGRGITGTKYHHVSPRIGLAWDPFGDGKTAIRLGAGIFYGATSGNEWNQPGNAQPFAIRQTFGSVNSVAHPYATTMSNGVTSSFPGGDIFPYTYTPGNAHFLTPASIESIGPKVQWPLSYQVNLAVQRQLPGKVSVTAAYVGTLSRHVPTMIDDNYAPYVPGLAGESSGQTGPGGYAARRQYDPGSAPGSLGQNIFLITSQTANYHSFQLSAKRPLSRNIMLNGFYVWSHALQSSNESAIGQMTAQDYGVAGNPFPSCNCGGLQEERGPMDADRRSLAVLSGTWNINYFHGSNFFMKEALNGWTIAPIVSLNSGGPFSITTGSNKNDDSANANRPDMVAGVSPLLDPHRCRICASGSELTAWFNTAAFIANGPGVPGGIGPGGADGNVGRDSLIGPGYRDIDLGIFRDIAFEHGVVFQFRAEATNAFNLVSLANPTASLSSGNNGKITGAAGSQRLIQLGGRLTF